MSGKLFRLSFMIIFCLLTAHARSQTPGDESFISQQAGKGFFPLADHGNAAPVFVGSEDWPGVKRAVNSLLNDIGEVSGIKPEQLTSLNKKQIIIIGTIGKSATIDKLIKTKKLDVGKVTGRWETYVIQTIHHPLKGVDDALVIAGSDKRGTIFGIYDLSAQIGISPWYWWADVPPKTKSAIYVKAICHTDGTPAVKYRGIFINDEAPAFSGWAQEKFGGVNHFVYEKIFELILRLKGNYLWPAMWGRAFNDDDKLDRGLADDYGIVMGTSHHEPMDRAQQEWKKYGKGEWNYETNKDILKDFWRKGIENMGSSETIVTIGMRGDGDTPMTEGSNIELLENIVKDQRQIISDVLKKDAATVPQMWALYKEVQEYYDKGMRVPDDVTLLLCDDNWGNIRKLPSLTEKPRKGGYGIYYHFDYVGGPRNYKWLNTNTISKTWEQMHLAYTYNAKQIWVVNVGDLKPMEYPISFFLDYAWNPEKWPVTKLHDYAVYWADQQFGKDHAEQIATMLSRYTRYNARRKPELLDQNTYNLINYEEFQQVVNDYNQLKDEAKQLSNMLPAKDKDAFYELVLHPIEACANLNEMYLETAKNVFFARQQDSIQANAAAVKVKMLFDKDAQISAYYNRQLANGKWDHMMDQTHIGYVSWSDPKNNRMPALRTFNNDSKPSDIKNNAETEQIKPVSLPAPEGYNGYFAAEAQHYNKAVSDALTSWITIPDYGNTLSGVTSWPVSAKRLEPGKNTAHLEYKIEIPDTGKVAVTCFISPTLDFRNGDGLYYAISFDDELPQKVKITPKVDSRDWAAMVSDNIRKLTTQHHIANAGTHILKFWVVDPAVVLEKVAVNFGGMKASYLGPPERK
jgi:hypothetical protein